MCVKHAVQVLSTWTSENYFYYYKVIIVFDLPINHSYKSLYGSRTVSYSASFVASSSCFFSFPHSLLKEDLQPSQSYENVLSMQLKVHVKVILYTRGYIPLRFNSESRLKGKQGEGHAGVRHVLAK